MEEKIPEYLPFNKDESNKLPKSYGSISEIEKKGVIIAVESAFMKLKNLYEAITPIYQEYGFKPPSAGVIARDLSEKIESSIIQHCKTFNKGLGHNDLSRGRERWEVKICKNSGLSINQSSIIDKENYIVVNYHKDTEIKSIWILWEAQDSFFSERKRNANIRYLVKEKSRTNIQILL
ncbi:hypothetical protein [Leptospira meyeri]|uniref:hypothetical protein n=1 Tax=Leptospira meyeri TaxID=29508 RepID=UPI00223DC063|nr:hypothetical protein [Leptospira meyeri]MCW7490984.1 hypothetical protein [Leptospira meyeri]